jgi:dipeptidyl aminopeptidase/acylaminoacyl peptidase
MPGGSRFLCRGLVCLFAIAGAGVAASQAMAQESVAAAPAAVRIPIEAIGKRPFLEGPRLSPDGSLIAATVDVQGTPALAVLNLFDRSKEMLMINVGDNEIRWYRWAGNDKLLISLLLEGKYYGHDVRVSRLLMYRISTRTPAAVGLKKQGVEGDDVLYVAEDGSYLLLAASRDIESYPGVYRVDLDSLEMDLVEAPQTSITEWFADGDGVVRGGSGHALGRMKFIYREGADGEFRTLSNARMDDYDGEFETFHVLPSGRKGVVKTNALTGRFGVYEFDWATSEIGKPVFEHAEVDIEDYRMTEAGDSVEGVRYTDDRERVVWFDGEMKELQKEVDDALAGRVNWISSASRDRTRFIVWTGTASEPGQYYYYDRDAGKLSRVAMPYEALKGFPLAPVRYVKFRARDGLEIPAYLTLPLGREAKALPLVLMPHGGPHARDTWEFDYWVQFLANRGYAVLQPNFRGSTGYGRDFLAKGFGQWGAGMQDDLTDGVSWLVAEGTVDPKRVCIMGGSYGGYAALMGAIRTPDQFRCAVSWAGVTDLDAMMRFDKNWMMPKGYRRWRDRIRGEEKVDLDTVSPVNLTDRITVPVLLMHGTGDKRVPSRQAEVFVKAMKKANKPLEYIEFPDADHSLSKTADRVRFLTAVEAFLDAHNPAERPQ